MEHWNKRVEASWEKFERVFDVQQNLKTPSVKHGAPKTPQAPKKVNKFQIRREGLKPRKLTYEQENVKKVERPNKVWEDSGIALWATSSAALRMKEEIDKENRPETGKRHKSKGKTRIKNDDRVVRDRSRKNDDFKSGFRHFRI